MTISELRAEEILETIIRSFLERGEVPTIEEVESEFDTYVAANDLSLPRFSTEDYGVAFNEESSASKYNGTNNTIKEDLDTIFRSLYLTTNKAVKLFDRWECKASKLENRVIGLEGRISRLLLLAQDTEGFLDIVGDTFTDSSLLELDLSTNVNINLGQNLITMAKSTGVSAVVDRIFLNDLVESQAVFNLTDQDSVVSVSAVNNTEPRFAFRDESRFWKTHVFASKRVNPIIGDLTISLAESIVVSKIQILLHTSEQNSTTKITPLYSVDGTNFIKIPSVNTVLESLEKMEFTFPEISLVKLKFIIEKNGHDQITSDNLFLYEFGAKEIALFKEGFNSSSTFKGTMVGKPLSITKPDTTLSLFNKVNLEVCEATSSDTFIDYFIAVGKNDTGTPKWLTTAGFVTAPAHIVAGVDTRLWTPISPSNRDEITHPQILDFTTISTLEQTGVGISYDKDGGPNFESPQRLYTLLQQDSSGSIIETPCSNKNPGGFTQSDRRYFFSNSSHRILDLQIDKAANVDIDNIKLWRNVGEKGITPGDSTKLVRDIQIGWEFSEPYYTTSIKVEPSQGMTIDVGNNPITIDQVSYVNVIGPTVLSQGIHKVKIHKDYWNSITPNLDTLAELKSSDILYPYNQKLLIEGYEYGSLYPDSEEQVYVGVDRFAGLVADRVGIFDIINNTKDTDYSKYAIDTDGPITSEVVATTADAPLSYVIVLNTKNTIADFMNEKFVLEFNLTDELFSFVALRAELRTSNNQLSPIFDEYRIKLAV